MRRVRIKSKRHCKRFNNAEYYSICNDWWLALAGKVVYLDQRCLVSLIIKPNGDSIQGLYLPNNAIAKRF